MFQYQLRNYDMKRITNDIEFQDFINQLSLDKPDAIAFDTETTGLNVMIDKPFLVGVGWKKLVYIFEPKKKWLEDFINATKKINFVFAHNAKFDFHMLLNAGVSLVDWNSIADSLVVARLTEYADDLNSIGLEELGQKYVAADSKFAGDVIKEHLKKIDAVQLKVLKNHLKEWLKENKYKYPVTEVIDAYRSRIQYIKTEYDDIFAHIDTIYRKANYEDSYKENPDLMVSYLADDIVILLEYLKVSIPVLNVVDPFYKVFNQENKLIPVVAELERTGMKVDIQYLVDSHYRVKDYIAKVYSNLHEITGRKFTSGQHKEIMKYFLEVHSIEMKNCDLKALEALVNVYNETVTKVANIIMELRTLDKWLTTYIDGMLDRVINGRIHTNINNQGAVTGRVSSDMQQQPKEPLLDSDNKELFHPRRAFVNDPGTRTFYFDYSQMELRLQAHYTLVLAGGDTNLCRAFMPFQCVQDGVRFDYNTTPMKGDWFDEKGNKWKPTDLHSVTTLKAFPGLDVNSSDFSHYRRLGKLANFLKNYGGGIDAIHRQLKVSEDVAQALNKGYYEAFPKVLDYQRWVDNQLQIFGYVENIYGRRYYIQNKKLFYKAYNYVIQGGCADLVKEKEIRVHHFIKQNKLKSRMVLPVHDEIQVSIHKDEEWIVPEIKRILDDNRSVIGTLPMICDVEVTNSNWADKEDYE